MNKTLKRNGCVTPIPTKHAGITFRSRFEADVARYLDSVGIGYRYEPRRIHFIDRSYLPDFVLENGIILEAKGWFKRSDQALMNGLKLHRPDLDFRMVFQNPNQVLKPLKSTAAKYCDRRKIPWCKGPEVPLEWLAPALDNLDTDTAEAALGTKGSPIPDAALLPRVETGGAAMTRH